MDNSDLARQIGELSARLASAEADLGVLRAKQDIHECLMRYCRGLDRCDRDLIASAYWPDAIDDMHRGTAMAELPDEIVGIVQTTVTGARVIGSQWIEVDGDSAISEATVVNVFVFDKDGTKFTRMRGCRYLDRYERRNGEWKVAFRTLVDDWGRVDEIKGYDHSTLIIRNEGKRTTEDMYYLLKSGVVGNA